MNRFKNPIKLKTEIGESIAKNVYCEMTNIKSEANVHEPLKNGKYATALADAEEINYKNIIFKTKYNISELNELKIYGHLCEYNDYNSSFKYIEIDKENPWILTNNQELKYYDYLDNPSNPTPYYKKIKMIRSFDYESLSKKQRKDKDIVYIYYEGSTIYLSDLVKIFGKDFFILPTNFSCSDVEWKIYDDGTISNYQRILHSTISAWNASEGDLPDGINIDLSTCLFQIEYSYETGEISFPILISNESNYDDTVYFNQTSRKIDPNRTARILQTYIDNMSGGSLMVSGTFESWKDIPEEGSVIVDAENSKKYIVNSISVSEYPHYLDATAQLTEYHAKRRTNMGADTDLQINYIPNNNLVYRKSFKCIQFEFDLSIDKVEEEDIYKNDKLDFLLKDDLNKLVFENLFKTGSYVYDLIGYPTIFKAGNNILFNERAYSNFIWDFSVYDSNPMPYNYTNTLGFVDTTQIYLYKGITKEQLNNYPLFTDIISEQQLLLENDIDKDAYEIFDYTLQASYKGINKTIVREEYVEELLNNSGFPNSTIRFYNTHFSKYDVINDESEVRRIDISLGILLYDDGVYTQSINLTYVGAIPNYKSIVIFSDDKPLFIKNFDEEQTIAEDFLIYIYPKLMTAIRDGVYGKDIK